jgi:hypothetical protein
MLASGVRGADRAPAIVDHSIGAGRPTTTRMAPHECGAYYRVFAQELLLECFELAGLAATRDKARECVVRARGAGAIRAAIGIEEH